MTVPAHLHLSTELPASPERAWRALQQPGTFLYVTRGVLGFPVLAGRTEPFVQGEADSGWLWLFHVVPMGRHHIHLIRLDDEEMVMSTEEHSRLLRRWDHTLRVEPLGPGRCRYHDDLVIDAGPLTPVVRASAALLFRYRQARWRRLARRHLAG